MELIYRWMVGEWGVCDVVGQATKKNRLIGRLTNNNIPLSYLKISNLKFHNLTTATSF